MIEDLVFWDQQTKKAFEEMCNDPNYINTREPVLKDLLYYAPSDEIFNKFRSFYTEVWNSTFPVTDEVVDELNFISNIENIRDNFMFIFAKFSIRKLRRLSMHIPRDCIKEVMVRLTAIDSPSDHRKILSSVYDIAPKERKIFFDLKPITPSV